MLLDIIVPHWNEPWSVGQKLFDSIALQRGIRQGDVNVILIQDGQEGQLDIEMLQEQYPFVKVVADNEGSGVSAARNTGLKLAEADWVMFCDFDDMFWTLTGLHSVLETIVTQGDSADVFWSEFWDEWKNDANGWAKRLMGYNTVYIHGRAYRREWLLQNNIWFDPRLTHSEDNLFNIEVWCKLNPERLKKFPEVFYLWTRRAESVTVNKEWKLKNREALWTWRMAVQDKFAQLGKYEDIPMSVWSTICECYYECNSERGWSEGTEAFDRRFYEWYKRNHLKAERLPMSEKVSIMDASREKAIQQGYLTIEKITLQDWLNNLELRFGSKKGGTS